MADTSRIDVSVKMPIDSVCDPMANTAEIGRTIHMTINAIGNRMANPPRVRWPVHGSIAMTINAIRQGMPKPGRIDIVSIETSVMSCVEAGVSQPPAQMRMIGQGLADTTGINVVTIAAGVRKTVCRSVRTRLAVDGVRKIP